MEEVKSTYRYAKISARKARLVMDQIRGKSVKEAGQILSFSDKRAAALIKKCFDSAVANATYEGRREHGNKVYREDDLFVTKCFVNEGPTRKGWIPRSKGMANPLKFRSSHFTVCVGEKENG